MYDTQTIVGKIEKLLKMQRKAKGDMCRTLGIGVNALSQFSRGREISCVSLARIADYLDVSVDYLLGRTDNENSHKEN